MKVTMFVTETSTQFNLKPETDHEKEYMKLLSQYKGVVSIFNGVDVGTCMGGYLRSYGTDKDITAIIISKPPEPPAEPR